MNNDERNMTPPKSQVHTTKLSGIPVPTVILLDKNDNKNRFPELGQAGSLGWPLAGKPVIKHMIEELNRLNVSNCFLLSNGNAQLLSDLITDELHWTYKMRVEALNFSLSSSQVLTAFSSLANKSGLLLVETDSISGCCIAEFLLKAYQATACVVKASLEGIPLGLTLMKNGKDGSIDEAVTVELERLQSIRLDSRRAFIDSNLGILAGTLQGRMPKLAINSRSGYWQHNRSYLSNKSLVRNSLFVDRGVHVSNGCELNNAVIYKNSVLENKVILHNSVVLPDSWVAANQVISDSIISGEQIIPINQFT